MEGDKVELVRLAFRVSAVGAELEELDRLLNEVVAPGMRSASASLRVIQARLRDLAGVERIDLQAAVQAADEIGRAAPAGVEPDAERAEELF